MVFLDVFIAIFLVWIVSLMCRRLALRHLQAHVRSQLNYISNAASLVLLAKLATVIYTNWKGETGVRRILPIRLYYGKSEFHAGCQWLLEVMDVGRGKRRTFAVNEISMWDEHENSDVPSGNGEGTVSPTDNL